MHPPSDLWPALTADHPPVPGEIRRDPADFRVDEVPAYPPSERGEHLFVRFEKTGLDTREAVRRMAEALDVPASAASWAGRKDRRAVTTQWASFHGAREDAARGLEVPGVRVLEAAAHERKLRTGHLRGNRFAIRVREVPADRTRQLRAALEHLTQVGVPNYYEEQRFGRGGANLERARRWLVQGGRPPRDRTRRKWDVSVLQSWVFNRVLAERIEEGLLGRAVAGDLMRKEDTGGLFVASSESEAQARVEAWEISPTGPMFGPKMRWPEEEAQRREERALEQAGLEPETLRRFGRLGQGTRRPLRVPLGEPELETTEDGVRLSFFLPSGSYATAVLRELFKEGLRVSPRDPAAG